jgi:hypothetical protein
MATTEKGKYIAIIPMHRSIPVGTLSRILTGIAGHLELTVAELLKRLGIE